MLITIGRVQKTHGVKGEIKIESLTDHSERFSGLRRVYLTSSRGESRECAVRSVRYMGGSPVPSSQGV